MTDPTPRPDDELVSAVLDGEATAVERARVEADPAARTRLAELAAVRDRVAAPVAVPPAAREQAVAAALAAFDTPAPTGGADPGPSGGAPAGPAFRSPDPGLRDELAARRARRSGSGGRYLAAAAAIVVVLFGTVVALRAVNPPAITTSASSDAAAPSTTATGGALSEPATEQGAETLDEAPTTTMRASQPPLTTTPAPPAGQLGPMGANVVMVDLGPVASVRDLRDQLLGEIDRIPDPSDPAATVPSGPPALARAEWASCAGYLAAVDDEVADLMAVGSATLDGRPTIAYAFSIGQVAHPAANGSIRIYAVDPATCEVLAAQTTR